MSSDTSYIADLPPENITYQLSSVETKVRKEQIQAPTYAPLDVHKNPYLAEPLGQGSLPNPNAVQAPPYPQVSSMKPQPPNMLPSRDIPQSTVSLSRMQDEEVVANYVPSKKLTRDFVNEEEDLSEERIIKRRRKKKQQSTQQEWIQELQIPLLLSILYYLFQMPWLHEILVQLLRHIPFLMTEGILNTYGIMVKALLFGAAFYTLNKTTDLAAIPSQD
jgi:hypothetical protein